MTLTLKIANQSFLHDTPAHEDTPPYWYWFGNKMFGISEEIIWINTDMLTLRCDLDLEYRNPIFSQDTLAYYDVSSDQVWLLKNQQFRRQSRKSHILILSALTVTLTLKIANTFFHKTLWLMMLHHHTKSGNKMFCGSENIIWTNIR